MRRRIIRLAGLAAPFLALIGPAVWAQNTVETIAGGGPNNIPVLKSSLGTPAAIALDSAGNIYLGDLDSERVLKVAMNGNVTVVAGNAARGGALGIGGPATSANLAYPSGVAVDSSGNVFIADRTFCAIREVSVQTGIISTVAGTGSCGYTGDGGPATSAQLNNPSGVTVDKSGNIFIADTNNCLIRGVFAATGIISTLAGTPPDTTGLLHCGYSGNGGLATGAEVGYVNNLALDGSGNLFLADPAFCTVREISASTGIISAVAGTGGSCGYTGDGGPATSSELNQPYGVAVDNSGNVFIADTTNCLIRKVTSSNAHISTVAGEYTAGCGYSGDGTSATSSQINEPYGVAVDSSGDIFIADYDNSVIREVSGLSSIMSTFAGVSVPDPERAGQLIGLAGYSGDGYLAAQAEIGFLNDTPYAAGLATDRNGNVFTADTVNNAVREISASTGIITTVAGSGIAGFSGDGGPATSAELYDPRDVAVDGSGNIFIADTGNGVIREVSASTGIINTVVGIPDSDYFGGGDSGPALSATLYFPYGVAVDGYGNIFIADTFDYVVREVTAVNGNIYTVAGNIALGAGDSGDGGPPGSALLGFTFGMSLDSAGNLFIPDPDNCVIREVSGSTGFISTVAGTRNTNGDYFCGYSGDGGPALSAVFDYPGTAGTDTSGDLVVRDDIWIRTVAGLAQGPAAAAVPFPNPLVFSTQQLNVSSSPLTVILSDRGSTATSVSTIDISGTNASDFSETDNCVGSSLTAGGGSCAISVIFTPSIAGTEIGLLTISDSAGMQTVDLSGTGAAGAPEFSPSVTTISFGNQQENIVSTPMGVTVTNSGTFNLTIGAIAVSGANASNFAISSDTCSGATLPPVTTNCNVTLTFRPTSTGPESATLEFTDNAAGSPQSIALTGTGTDFAIGLVSGGSASATVAAGSPATYYLQVTPIGGFNGTVELSCTGAPTESTCTLSEPSATPNGSTPASFSVQVTTMAPSIAPPGVNRQRRPFDGLRIVPIVLMIALASTVLAFFTRFGATIAQRRRAFAIAMPLGLLLLAIILSGCGGGGGGSGSTGPPSGGTPIGTYTLTITGTTTTNGVSRSQTVTLIVN